MQGVKGNADKDSDVDVDSIVERIKKGELKLPPSSTKYPSSTTTSGRSSQSDYNKINTVATTFRPTLIPTTRSPYVSVSPNSVSSNDKYVTSASTLTGHVFNSIGTTSKPSASSKYSTSGQYSSSFDSSSNEIGSSTTPSSSSSPNFLQSSTYVDYNSRPTQVTIKAPVTSARVTPLFPTSSPQPSYANSKESLSNLLRREGLFAMAKYLRQSGLDGVLNETGKFIISYR